MAVDRDGPSSFAPLGASRDHGPTMSGIGFARGLMVERASRGQLQCLIEQSHEPISDSRADRVDSAPPRTTEGSNDVPWRRS